MNVFLLILSLLISCIVVSTAFQFSPHDVHHSLGRPASSSVVTTWSSPDSSASDGAESEFDVSADDLDETVLRINFSFDDEKGSSALAALQKFTQSFPFAAVLPVQPLTYLPGERMRCLIVQYIIVCLSLIFLFKHAFKPVTSPDGNPGVKVTFLRKKTAEKGSMDGGMMFSSCLVSEEDCDEDGLDNYKKSIQLTAWRITKGQTVSKMFSEKQVVLAFVKGLSEDKGKELLAEGNVKVDSVFHLWM